MTQPVRRAGAFAALSTLSLAVPLVGPVAAMPLAVLAVLGALVITDGPIFEVFAYPQDRDVGRLYGLLTFVLAIFALALIAVSSSMTIGIFVGTVFLVGFGAFANQLTRRVVDRELLHVVGFCLGGGVAALVGYGLTLVIEGIALDPAVPRLLFLVVSGVLLAALLRDMLFSYDLPIVMLAVGLLLWLLAELDPPIDTTAVVVALTITGVIGYLSYALDTASIAGMLTGTLLGFMTIVLGGYDWFFVLISFFAIGSLSTKYQYDRKVKRGVAQGNDGARGSANVLGNSAVALVAVLGYAASDGGMIPGDATLFLFAFAGSIATALSDTLSSEIGSVFDTPRLITTMESVEPGTDGGVTWHGTIAGVCGATIVAVISFLLFPVVDTVAIGIIAVAGVIGMIVDSILGATIEGAVFGNQTVNFLATLAGAIVSGLLLLSFIVLG